HFPWHFDFISSNLFVFAGINVVKRKLPAHDNLKLIITQGNKFTVKESSTFRTIEIIFELGVTFNYSLPDGTEISGAWALEGDKLVGKFKRLDNGNALNTVREIIGGEMVQRKQSKVWLEKTREFSS
uniref:Fatty acid binding protein 2 n=1 Tax=Bos taurus TaxID=9913 RepID=A0AAA9S398_BOVIN